MNTREKKIRSKLISPEILNLNHVPQSKEISSSSLELDPGSLDPESPLLQGHAKILGCGSIVVVRTEIFLVIIHQISEEVRKNMRIVKIIIGRKKKNSWSLHKLLANLKSPLSSTLGSYLHSLKHCWEQLNATHWKKKSQILNGFWDDSTKQKFNAWYIVVWNRHLVFNSLDKVWHPRKYRKYQPGKYILLHSLDKVFQMLLN